MRRIAIAAASVALVLTAACSGGGEPEQAKASPSAEPQDPRAPILAKIDALADVTLDELDPPKAPQGFTQRETDYYADLLTTLMKSSLEDEKWWTAEPDRKTIRSFMAPLPPQSRDATLANDYTSGDSPVAQYMVSIFDPEAQPVGPPRIVKAAWDTETYVPEGQAVRFQRVRLGVQAIYRTGEDERPVLLRRELSLNGVNTFMPGAWPGFGYYSTITGVDSCALYDDGVYRAVAKPAEDVSSYRDWLKDARRKGWEPLGATVEKDNDPDAKRQDACADRSES